MGVIEQISTFIVVVVFLFYIFSYSQDLNSEKFVGNTALLVAGYAIPFPLGVVLFLGVPLGGIFIVLWMGWLQNL